MRIGKSGLLLRLAGIAAPCILLACQSETTAPQTLVSPLIPLRVGTTFSYHSTDTLIGAVSSSDSAAPDSDFTLRVVSEVADYTGRRWASLDAPVRMFGSAQYASFIFTNAADGLRSVWSSYPGGPVVPNYLIFPYPAARGTRGQFGAVVSAADTIITVPAGTFHCVRYDDYSPMAGAPPTWSLFIAPGTGVVQRIAMITAFYGPGLFQVVSRHDRIYRLAAVGAP